MLGALRAEQCTTCLVRGSFVCDLLREQERKTQQTPEAVFRISWAFCSVSRIDLPHRGQLAQALRANRPKVFLALPVVALPVVLFFLDTCGHICGSAVSGHVCGSAVFGHVCGSAVSGHVCGSAVSGHVCGSASCVSHTSIRFWPRLWLCSLWPRL